MAFLDTVKKWLGMDGKKEAMQQPTADAPNMSAPAMNNTPAEPAESMSAAAVTPAESTPAEPTGQANGSAEDKIQEVQAELNKMDEQPAKAAPSMENESTDDTNKEGENLAA